MNIVWQILMYDSFNFFYLECNLRRTYVFVTIEGKSKDKIINKRRDKATISLIPIWPYHILSVSQVGKQTKVCDFITLPKSPAN